MENIRKWLIIALVAITAAFSIRIVYAEAMSKSEQKTFAKALKFEKKNNTAAALKEYDKIIKKNPSSSETLDRIAYIHMKEGRRQEAEDAARKAIQAGGECPISYNIIGMMHERNGNIGYAEKYYLKAIEKDPEYAAAYNNMGNLALKRGSAENALKYYSKAIEKDPKNPLYFNNSGYAMELQGNIADAMEEYEKADKLGDKSGAAKKNLERIKFRNEAKRLSDKDKETLKTICRSKMPLNFHVTEVLKDEQNGNAAIWESSGNSNQRYIIKMLPKGNAFTETIFAQMVSEHREQLEKMLETLSGTNRLTITGQGYIMTSDRRIMRIYADASKESIPLEGTFCMISKANPDRHAIILIIANKGFFDKKSSDIFIKEAYKGI